MVSLVRFLVHECHECPSRNTLLSTFEPKAKKPPCSLVPESGTSLLPSLLSEAVSTQWHFDVASFLLDSSLAPAELHA